MHKVTNNNKCFLKNHCDHIKPIISDSIYNKRDKDILIYADLAQHEATKRCASPNPHPRHPQGVETWFQHPPLLPQVRPQSALRRLWPKGPVATRFVWLNNSLNLGQAQISQHGLIYMHFESSTPFDHSYTRNHEI